jgi:hypothetical protein
MFASFQPRQPRLSPQFQQAIEDRDALGAPETTISGLSMTRDRRESRRHAIVFKLGKQRRTRSRTSGAICATINHGRRWRATNRAGADSDRSAFSGLRWIEPRDGTATTQNNRASERSPPAAIERNARPSGKRSAPELQAAEFRCATTSEQSAGR